MATAGPTAVQVEQGEQGLPDEGGSATGSRGHRTTGEHRHIIQNRDGKISERNSYSNDPHPPKG